MKKIVVGMSGGVDSSVVAFLLKQEGYEVHGVTMRTWAENDENMNKAIEDAKKVAECLGIQHEVVDFSKEFKCNVVDNFINEYLKGRTPNPCVRCNRFVKWQAILDYAKSKGINTIATGHYAKIIQRPNGRLSVACADSIKDQAYALWMLTQEQLQSTVMPLGKYDKDEIRDIAKEAKLPIADKADSQDICFIPDGDYGQFLVRMKGKEIEKCGEFVDPKGCVLGKHKGIIHYTIGQRKGLGLSLKEPGYVTKLDVDGNKVVVGTNSDVFAKELVATDINYMGLNVDEKNIRCMAKIRYAHRGADCEVIFNDDNTVTVVFDEPQRAITPGQSIVFYDAATWAILAGAVIVDKRK